MTTRRLHTLNETENSLSRERVTSGRTNSYDGSGFRRMGKRDDGGEGWLSVCRWHWQFGILASSFPPSCYILAVSHKVRPSQNTVSPSPKVCKVTYYMGFKAENFHRNSQQCRRRCLRSRISRCIVNRRIRSDQLANSSSICMCIAFHLGRSIGSCLAMTAV